MNCRPPRVADRPIPTKDQPQMKVETLNTAPCRVRVVVKAEADETRADYEHVFQEYAQHGRIRGFRPGKAPRTVVERNFQQAINGDVRSRLIGRLYRQALEGEKLAPVAILDVADVVFSPASGISFAMTVDVAPDFKLPQYEHIPVKAEDTTVADAQVDAQVERLRASLARYEESADRVVARGDLVQIDYQATSEGKPLAELAGECAGLDAAVDHWARADEPEFVPGLALGLIGFKAGTSQTIPVTFPQNYQVEGVRGRQAQYQVTVKAVRERILPVEAEFLKQFGCETLEQLRDRVRGSLQSAANQREQARQRQAVMDFLLRQTEFELPQSVVAEETDLTVRGLLRDIASHGASREEVEKHRDEILSSASHAARDRVRLRYILARIAEAEHIRETEAEIAERLREMAQRHQTTPEKLRNMIEERHGMESLRADIRADKALDSLMANAKLT